MAGRREHGHAGDPRQQGEVHDAVVTRSVVAGDAGTVDAEDHRKVVEAHVEVELVPGTVEKGGVDGDDGPKACHGHAGGRSHRVLFGDPDVDEPIGIAAGELEQSAGARHGCRDAPPARGGARPHEGATRRMPRYNCLPARRCRLRHVPSPDRRARCRGAASRRPPRRVRSRGPSRCARGGRRAPHSRATRWSATSSSSRSCPSTGPS